MRSCRLRLLRCSINTATSLSTPTTLGPAYRSDRSLLRYAIDQGAVIVSKDEDFADLLIIGVDLPALVWVRAGNTRRAALLAWFEPLIDQIVSMIEAGNRLIQLR